jgi:NAD(P)-dependent dehydrogenase (short-subunit alcohol dehydrogenase family)
MSATTAPVVLVTGGVRGLGLAAARAQLGCGARVHVTYRSSASDARALEKEFDGRVHRADATLAEDWARLVRSVRERDGGLDAWVHAVGEYVHGPLEALAAADARRMLASNVETAVLGFGALRTALRERRGSCVFFGCAGLDTSRARRDAAMYTAAKSALLVLVRSWALEEAAHGVRVNMISPGHVPHEHASDDTRDPRLWERIPMQRPGTPNEVASAVAWLLSPHSAYVTGANLDVAGGYML